MKKRVLFLCTANSCRSQMAEGLINHYIGDRFSASSAGTRATAVNPRAIRVMRELGIDIAHHRSKELGEFAGETFDYVITLCDSANEQCPLFFGGVTHTHLGFADPAGATGSEAEIDEAFRRVRDDLKERLLAFFRAN
ncbi:arsenate reductase [Geotalea uraniireducens]|uniref:Arsenate reductase n=1 Tax=Geotalea uraniireducens TaxID=351604 RepID=A0ABM8EPZ5_9BACT|nr:arsenate reductase ArsC [Geotalea uraniireducens]BDV44522.1 arsenate reductase [Geotalea uraniireducens]